MKYQLTILGLWLIAIVTTMLIVEQPGVFTRLGPLYAICMIGSVLTIRRLQRKD